MSTTLQLPDEVWSRIVNLRCVQDRKSPIDEAHLWLELRRVNRTFANAVEKYNIDRYLRRATMGFDFGMGYVQKPRNPDHKDDQIKLKMSTEFSFDGFDEKNPRLAVLADHDCAPHFRRYIAELLFNEGGFLFMEETYRIQHVMSLRHHVQDIPLIHMESNIGPDEPFVLKFDWRATFAVWWTEFKALEDDGQRNEASNFAFAEGLKAGPQDPSAPFANIGKIIARIAAQRYAAIRRIRRRRIRRLLTKLDPHLRLKERTEDFWDDLSRSGEDEAIKGIKDMTTSMNFAEFSDDSEADDEPAGVHGIDDDEEDAEDQGESGDAGSESENSVD